MKLWLGRRRRRAVEMAAFESVARSHVGRVRAINEDRFLDRPDLGLWAVADGMGGHDAGEVAAAMLVGALAPPAPPASAQALLGHLRGAVARVNAALVARAAGTGGRGVAGATMVALVLAEDHYVCAWAGDSRAYLLRGGTLYRITRDHSVVQQLVDGGALTAAEARTHRHANVVTRAVGAAARLDLEERRAPIRPGDLYLLCSDGLTGMLDDAEIAAALCEDEFGEGADRLLALCLERGARDNVTLLLVRVPASARPPGSALGLAISRRDGRG